MTKRENDAIWAAAEEANRKFGQWMPQLWIEIFIKELASTPPATSAGLGADKLRELASCLDRALGDTDPSINPDYTDAEIKRDYPVFWVCQQLNAILALLSRAGDQSNSTQKDGSR